MLDGSAAVRKSSSVVGDYGFYRTMWGHEELIMVESYFTQIGFILFPICAYQLWASGKSFNRLPFRLFGLGFYGGIAAILCQRFPVLIFGQTENFQCVPIILAILYGRRSAGALAMALLILYQVLIHQPNLTWSILGVLTYSAIPLILCNGFYQRTRNQRVVIAASLTVVTLPVELAFLAVFFWSQFGNTGFAQLGRLSPFLGAACGIQVAIMGMAFLMIEAILETARVQSRLQSLIQYNPLGICTLTNEFKFVHVNAAYESITGYKAFELLGRGMDRLWFSEEMGPATAVADSVFDGQVQADLEIRLRHKSGREVFVRGTMVPMYEWERVVGYFWILTDITQWRKTNEAIRQSEKLSAIGQMAAGIAHEIRNPLTALQGFLKLLSETEGKNHYIDIMKDELERIGSIASELLMLSKPHVREFTSRNLCDELNSVVNLVNAHAVMNNVTILTDWEAPLPNVECDPVQVKQVFINIIKNAIEATMPGGTIQIAAVQHDVNAIALRVTDTGVGIPQEILGKLGEPFLTTKSSGTGLGLMVCKNIISAHHGTFTLASEVGKGTTVTIVLPIHQPSEMESEKVLIAN